MAEELGRGRERGLEPDALRGGRAHVHIIPGGCGLAGVLKHAVGRFEELLNEAVVVPVEMTQKNRHDRCL